ncbi:MAG: sulfite exporter TauE/SafE family protein [Rhodobacteraceae bacterium]|nr:sulfite exporter TauE/SafE family protein [Paracoccaceae bacterium]
MDISALFILLLILAVLLAGISKGGFGSGASFICIPILALVIEPTQALGIMLPLLMVMDAVSLKLYWKKWDHNNAKVIILGGLLGVIIAIFFHRVASTNLIQILLGLISIGFVCFEVLKNSFILRISRMTFNNKIGVFIGISAGFTSFISHAGGPPVALFLLSQKMSKTLYQSTTVISFWAINIFKVVPYSFLGFFTWETVKIDILLAPIAIFGTIAGAHVHKIIPESLFFIFTYILLFLAGTKLLYDGILT